ncbi:hypothetical protein TYRP_009829 [Tyrophagus putrescentiae]|nr:hypothetical protein TYRP_009829 [Tyrophagus putrescentiae]
MKKKVGKKQSKPSPKSVNQSVENRRHQVLEPAKLGGQVYGNVLQRTQIADAIPFSSLLPQLLFLLGVLEQLPTEPVVPVAAVDVHRTGGDEAGQLVIAEHQRALQALLPVLVVVLDRLVGVGEHGDEKGENDEDEEHHEGVEVEAAEPPDEPGAGRLQAVEGGEHFVAVHQREERLRGAAQGAELGVRRAEDDPAAVAEAAVEDQNTEEEANHPGEGVLQRHYQHVVLREEGEVAEEAEPDQEVADAQQRRDEAVVVDGAQVEAVAPRAGRRG